MERRDGAREDAERVARDVRAVDVVRAEQAEQRAEERELCARVGGRERADERREEVLGAEEQAHAARVGGRVLEQARGTARSDRAAVRDAVERVAQVVEQLAVRALLRALEQRQRVRVLVVVVVVALAARLCARGTLGRAFPWLPYMLLLFLWLWFLHNAAAAAVVCAGDFTGHWCLFLHTAPSPPPWC